MHNKKIWFACITFLFCCIPPTYAQKVIQLEPSARWIEKQWNAKWITNRDGSKVDYGVHRFRKAFNIEQVPDSFIINVSADQRYELFVNGVRVCRGSARGDLYKWYYETFDIAPFLKQGANILSATVWNYGEWTPGAQVSHSTGLIVQGNTPHEEIVNTDSSWKTLNDKSIEPSLVYIQDVGPGDIIYGDKYPWGWTAVGFDDSLWSMVIEKEPGQPFGTGIQYIRALVPRTIPMMEEKDEPALGIRRATGVKVEDNFRKNKPLAIPANTKATVLLDQGYLTNAYLTLSVSKGRDSRISLTYAEGLYIGPDDKGNRNEIEGKYMFGYVDTFYPEGSENRIYSPLWLRTYRYIQLEVETKEQELVINSLNGEFTGYPFEENGSFKSDDKRLTDIWNVGWRTARLCAGETYYDCPYYEQLQYTGDTRIQSLISLYVSGDDRLMRKAIDDIALSITPDGILRSRYPARNSQIIPPFSLYWINMLHDYWMHREDDAYVESHASVLRNILDWYESKIDTQTGMLAAMPHWNFTDWTAEWPTSWVIPTGGVPPGGIDGGSAILTLQFAYALNDAIELLSYWGDEVASLKYGKLKQSLCKATIAKCYDKEKGLLSDDIKRSSYSQHVSIMGILSGAIDESKYKDVFNKLNTDKSLIQTTVYYRFYLFRAMLKAGLADQYVSSLDIWHNMLASGLTTFAERPEPSRSDCHAWSASTNYYFLSLVCGIMPQSPGFKTVAIEPHLGYLNKVEGSMPHPLGKIEVSFVKEKGKLSGYVILPSGLTGVYKYGNENLQLISGKNIIK
ncbi:alpha-L-rhamnosidase C-terminal domain-containing protein [uncultured Dysgonomonas sp.]|uniref:Alpha-L-rhamnosidase n=1 Tax=uncultured Dysgonomonas sp. TaxID=206096 RepID=A0A212ITK5_9BACT|nr:alpha-L-rhamnosidase C-terminal domain-containing protein [uncultured Dysgonomonas sp.]SBV90548.1 Alpha-L-rhamnosidase [uncultured Dysgonomonas sp.]